jgi:hypothetical protein
MRLRESESWYRRWPLLTHRSQRRGWLWGYARFGDISTMPAILVRPILFGYPWKNESSLLIWVYQPPCRMPNAPLASPQDATDVQYFTSPRVVVYQKFCDEFFGPLSTAWQYLADTNRHTKINKNKTRMAHGVSVLGGGIPISNGSHHPFLCRYKRQACIC